MLQNVFYTYLRKDSVSDPEFFYELSYKIQLPADTHAISWDNLTQDSRNVYKVDLEGIQDEEFVMTLQTSQDQAITDHQASLDGRIKIFGLTDETNIRFRLKLSSGGNSGNGSTKHSGDADD